MSCDVLVMSEAGVKLDHQRLAKTVEIKTSSSGAVNIMLPSYVTGQLSTGIS